jgi:hypothetical protein
MHRDITNIFITRAQTHTEHNVHRTQKDLNFQQKISLIPTLLQT